MSLQSWVKAGSSLLSMISRSKTVLARPWSVDSPPRNRVREERRANAGKDRLREGLNAEEAEEDDGDDDDDDDDEDDEDDEDDDDDDRSDTVADSPLSHDVHITLACSEVSSGMISGRCSNNSLQGMPAR